MAQNRSKEINEFLEKIGKLYDQNKDLEITHDTIYALLRDYGYEEKELEDNKNSINSFTNILKEKKKMKNLEIRESSFTNILYFNNNSLTEKDKEYGAIKIIASFDKSNLERCSLKLINYINSRNIKCEGKVWNQLRSDNLIIRVFNYNDALKILDYMNNHNEISLPSNPTHPFMAREGIAGITFDNNIPYNKILSYILASYLQNKRDKNSLNKVSCTDFQKFVKGMYDDIFVKGRSTQEFLQSKTFKNENSYGFVSTFKDYLQGFIILNMELTNNFNLESIFNAYETFKEDNNNYIIQLNNLLNGKNIDNKEILLNKRKETFDEYIRYISEKESVEKAIMSIENYVSTLNFSYITRQNSFRDKFKKELSVDKIVAICNGNLKEYVYNLLGINQKEEKQVEEKIEKEPIKKIDKEEPKVIEKEEIEKPTTKEEVKEEKTKEERKKYIPEDSDDLYAYQLFIAACNETYLKYGLDQLKCAIVNLINNHSYGYFTNGDKKYRERLINSVSPRSIKKYIMIYLDENEIDTKYATLSDFCNIFETINTKEKNNIR